MAVHFVRGEITKWVLVVLSGKLGLSRALSVASVHGRFGLVVCMIVDAGLQRLQ